MSTLTPSTALLLGCTPLLVLLGAPAAAQDISVCVVAGSGCDHHGPGAVQRAVDAATDGDVITVSDGQHVADGSRDIRFGDLIIRGGILINNKSLTLRGSGNTQLTTTAAHPASTLVIHDSTTTLENLAVQAAPPLSAEDDIYDGHGVFVVDARATLSSITFTGIEKMALSVRGASTVGAHNVRLLDGHVGVWVEENGQVALTDCYIGNNDSAAIAAYMQAKVTVNGCVLENNEDDGLYAAANASITADASLFLRNAPYAARAVDAAQITVRNSTFFDNAANSNDAKRVKLRDGHIFPGAAGHAP